MGGSRHPGLTTVGNALTASRLVLLPFIIWGIVTNRGWVAVAGMLAAWVTDLLDGRISRWLRQASSFGMTLDSTVDFVLIYSLFIAFYAAERLYAYQFTIVYVGMLFTLLLQLYFLASSDSEVEKTTIGKLTGTLQYAYLIFLVVREVVRPSRAVEIVNVAMFVALATAILAASIEAVKLLRDAAASVEDTGNDE